MVLSTYHIASVRLLVHESMRLSLAFVEPRSRSVEFCIVLTVELQERGQPAPGFIRTLPLRRSRALCGRPGAGRGRICPCPPSPATQHDVGTSGAAPIVLRFSNDMVHRNIL